jgi:hypothetical protein
MKIAASRFLGFFPFAFGSGEILHPCRSRPLRASLRVAPATVKRLGDFLPDWHHLNLHCGRKEARVLSPR